MSAVAPSMSSTTLSARAARAARRDLLRQHALASEQLSVKVVDSKQPSAKKKTTKKRWAKKKTASTTARIRNDKRRLDNLARDVVKGRDALVRLQRSLSQESKELTAKCKELDVKRRRLDDREKDIEVQESKLRQREAKVIRTESSLLMRVKERTRGMIKSAETSVKDAKTAVKDAEMKTKDAETAVKYAEMKTKDAENVMEKAKRESSLLIVDAETKAMDILSDAEKASGETLASACRISENARADRKSALTQLAQANIKVAEIEEEARQKAVRTKHIAYKAATAMKKEAELIKAEAAKIKFDASLLKSEAKAMKSEAETMKSEAEAIKNEAMKMMEESKVENSSVTSTEEKLAQLSIGSGEVEKSGIRKKSKSVSFAPTTKTNNGSTFLAYDLFRNVVISEIRRAEEQAAMVHFERGVASLGDGAMLSQFGNLLNGIKAKHKRRYYSIGVAIAGQPKEAYVAAVRRLISILRDLKIKPKVAAIPQGASGANCYFYPRNWNTLVRLMGDFLAHIGIVLSYDVRSAALAVDDSEPVLREAENRVADPRLTVRSRAVAGPAPAPTMTMWTENELAKSRTIYSTVSSFGEPVVAM